MNQNKKKKIDEKTTKTTALFIGRFQPFHQGHAAVLKRLVKRYSLVKIGIGSAQYSSTMANPLSLQERRTMINILLKKEKISNVKIYGIPDVHNNKKWVEHVSRIVGDFDVVYSGNPLVLQLFREKRFTVKKIKKIGDCSGTRIRTAMGLGGDVDRVVPSVVLDYLKKIDAFKRIRRLCRNL